MLDREDEPLLVELLRPIVDRELVAGTDAEDAAARVLDDARAVADAGAFMLVLEGIPSDLAASITEAISIPTIGIGAGPACDGQVLVCYDLLGLTPELRPKFVKQYASWFEDGKLAAARYCDEVRTGAFPTEEYAFGQVRRDESVMGAASGVSVSATALPSNPERTGAGYGPVS